MSWIVKCLYNNILTLELVGEGLLWFIGRLFWIYLLK